MSRRATLTLTLGLSFAFNAGACALIDSGGGDPCEEAYYTVVDCLGATDAPDPTAEELEACNDDPVALAEAECVNSLDHPCLDLSDCVMSQPSEPFALMGLVAVSSE